MTVPSRGHRTVPHTADIRIEAWAPTRDACLAEAVAALVSSFADTTDARPGRTHTAVVPATTDDDLLAAVLDEVIFILDTAGAVPLDLHLDQGPDGLLHIRMSVTPADGLELTGAIPKAVTLSGLHLTHAGERWTCAATIDV
jgi:SHS2 domain-containing protein